MSFASALFYIQAFARYIWHFQAIKPFEFNFFAFSLKLRQYLIF